MILLIKTFRKANHMTQEEIAEKLNITQPTYARYEKGEISLTLEMAKEIADIYQVKVDDLIC